MWHLEDLRLIFLVESTQNLLIHMTSHAVLGDQNLLSGLRRWVKPSKSLIANGFYHTKILKLRLHTGKLFCRAFKGKSLKVYGLPYL